MAPLQFLRTRIASILLSPAAQKLDFYLDNIHVDGSGLSYVALALIPTPQESQGLSIVIGGIDPKALANYDPTTNTFHFPSANYGLTPFERMTILRECVHAYRDALGSTFLTRTGRVSTRAVSEEAPALVAGALFYIEDEGPQTVSGSRTPWWALSGVYAQAYSLATTMRLGGAKGCNVTGARGLLGVA